MAMHNPTRLILAALATLLASPADAGGRDRLELRYTGLELPGAPSVILPADLDGDGHQDLAILVAYTEWHQIGIEESTEMDAIEGLVEVLTIVPSLTDRRELLVFLGREGGYRPLAGALELDRSVLSLELGPPDQPILALTDDGISVLRLTGEGRAARLELEPLFEDRPVLARTGTFVPDLGLAHDLDGDGQRDLLFPTVDGAAVYLSRGGHLLGDSAARLRWPAGDQPENLLVRHYPLPKVADFDGDGRPDLLLPGAGHPWRRFHVLLNAGEGRFRDPVAPLGDGDQDRGEESEPEDAGAEEENVEASDRGRVVYFGDLDGDGVAEYVTQTELTDEESGLRREIREAKQPPFRYRLYRMRPDLSMADTPYLEFEAIGYAFDDDDDIGLPAGFQDLDGDGRQDLVTMTLDFSLMQAVRVLTTHRISIGLDFHLWCQDAGGRFHAVRGLDLSGKFRLDLDDLRIGELSQFAGDFDADGKADFVQMGRGRDVSIHRGRDGCFYPPKPDLVIRLKEEPRDLKLVQVKDLDADGLTDLLVIQPQKITEPGVTPPVRLDLYLSGGGE